MALGMIFFLLNRLSSAPAGKGFQLEISEKVSAGAVKFLQTEYYYLVPFVVVMGAFIIGVLEGQEDPPKGESVKGGWQNCVCFVFGAILSASAGWGGMKIATAANVKTMEAAKTGLNPALQIAFSGGAVMGFTVVASGLLGVVVLFFAFSMAKDGADKVENFERYMQESIRFLSGFGFGASSIALFFALLAFPPATFSTFSCSFTTFPCSSSRVSIFSSSVITSFCCSTILLFS